MDENERALYIISVAAELAGVHPQTLRIYERKGLIEPKRTEGRSRRYSDRDIALLLHIQELTNEGVGLSGVKRILEPEAPPQDAGGRGGFGARSPRPRSASIASTGATSCPSARPSCTSGAAEDWRPDGIKLT